MNVLSLPLHVYLNHAKWQQIFDTKLGFKTRRLVTYAANRLETFDDFTVRFGYGIICLL